MIKLNSHFMFFRSFRAKVTATLILLICFFAIINNVLIYQYSLRFQLNQLRDKLMIIAHTAALTLDPETILAIPLDKSGMDSPQYKALGARLVRIRGASPSLTHIYIVKKTEKGNVLKFVIDIHTGSYYTRTPQAVPGDEYSAASYPELLDAFTMPSAGNNMVSDKWGVFLSGYSPVRDKTGKVIAVVGIDMSANDVYYVEKQMERRAVFVLILGVLLAGIIGLMISNRVVSATKKIAIGTRHISSGDLGYKVGVKGSDETSELAIAFNKMGSNLYQARKALIDYFYRAMQSLIRVLEAKDTYAIGHSDRVADYSVKIAKQMGLPSEKIELLREAALLHDIGKLGIQEMILSKKVVLSNEDWHIIHKHPEIGEEILRPISLDIGLLAVVRGHHERYDGKGYPDGLKGDKIDLLTAIVAVADSYDAMVSSRSYKKNMDKTDAIEQLKANRGLQFDPKVIDAFIEVLKKK